MSDSNQAHPAEPISPSPSNSQTDKVEEASGQSSGTVPNASTAPPVQNAQKRKRETAEEKDKKLAQMVADLVDARIKAASESAAPPPAKKKRVAKEPTAKVAKVPKVPKAPKPAKAVKAAPKKVAAPKKPAAAKKPAAPKKPAPKKAPAAKKAPAIKAAAIKPPAAPSKAATSKAMHTAPVQITPHQQKLNNMYRSIFS